VAEIDVRHVAKLARLALSEAETERFGVQLASLLEHVQTLESLPTADVPASALVIPARNEMRDDVEVPPLSRDVVLASAPQVEGPYFRVPRIIAEE